MELELSMPHVLCFLLLFSVSCTQEAKKYKQWKIKLSDAHAEIGWLVVELPLDFDTLHTWHRASDYSGGEQKYYRVQSSLETMREERQYFVEPVDSIKSFTIIHFRNSKRHSCEGHTLKSALYGLYADVMDVYGYPKFDLLDTMEIAGQQYAYSAYTDTLDDRIKKRFYIVTCFNGNRLYCGFLDGRFNSSKADFLSECKHILNTIKLSASN